MSKNFPIQPITSIESLHDFLDLNALSVSHKRDLTNLVVKFRNETISDIDKQFAQWEIEALIFHFQSDETFSFSYSTGKNVGEIISPPILDDFQKKAFGYLIKRANDAKNVLLIARYNHLLWKSPKGIKNNLYAKRAVEAYVQLLYYYLNPESEMSDFLEIGNTFEKLVNLCCKIKPDYNSSLMQLQKKVLFESPHIPFYVRHSVLKTMIDNSKLFRVNSFAHTLNVFTKELETNVNSLDRYLWIHSYFPTALSIARLLKSGISFWQEQLGDFHFNVAESEKDETRNWLKYSSYTSALGAYQNAGNREKTRQVQQIIFHMKPDVKLPTIRVNRTDKEIEALTRSGDFIKMCCENLLKESPEVIYASLVEGWFYPSKDMILKLIAKDQYSYEEMFSVIEYDKNKNIDFSKPDAKNAKFNRHYHSHIDMVTLQFLFYVFVPGIKSGHLTHVNLLEYLLKNTWLGKPYLKTDMGGREVGINWISVISPSIVEFFNQVSKLCSDESYTPNYVMCTDSLTLKMEGIFRNFSERLNVSTTVFKKQGTQEMYIHNVIDNELLREYFDEDDIQFFKYLFDNDGGINLRNNVAHCFYNALEYNIEKMLLLLASLLKIAKYNVSEDDL